MDCKYKIVIGSDHAGYALKEKIKKKLKESGYEYEDFGTDSAESVDYADIIHPLASEISKGKYVRGIILCGSGNGVSMTANKYEGVRAALCWRREIAKYARLHNDANILALPARYLSSSQAFKIIDVFLNTAFENGRHRIRVDKISSVIH